ERRRHVDDRGIRAGALHGLGHRAEHRQAQVGGAALAGGHVADHLGAVFDGLFAVEGALRAGEALADDLGVLVDQNAHWLLSAALTTCWAASVRLVAGMMFRPLSASIFAPSWALLPSRRTTTGT